ncbi:MAG: hypothetical protein F6K41_11130 [Symploca sp. SIO3E6]|nr:hypothetical protein [Caldora sp. SIO3E6]
MPESCSSLVAACSPSYFIREQGGRECGEMGRWGDGEMGRWGDGGEIYYIISAKMME